MAGPVGDVVPDGFVVEDGLETLGFSLVNDFNAVLHVLDAVGVHKEPCERADRRQYCAGDSKLDSFRKVDSEGDSQGCHVVGIPPLVGDEPVEGRHEDHHGYGEVLADLEDVIPGGDNLVRGQVGGYQRWYGIVGCAKGITWTENAM